MPKATVTEMQVVNGYFVEVTKEVEVIDYDDCIAIMDEAIAKQCADDDSEGVEDNRLRLNSKALRAFPDSNCVRDAITSYLGSLDPYSTEWSEWIDEYGEGNLFHKFCSEQGIEVDVTIGNIKETYHV